MTPAFLSCVLAAAIGAFADDDDPYRWLEEVLGEKPMAWVKERNAESTGELTRAEQFRRSRAASARSSIPGADPDDREGRRITTTTSGATRRTRAGSGGGRRSTNTARPSRTGRSCSTSTRWRREEKENWVWHGADVLKPGHRAGPDLALARRGRRGRRPRVRHREQGVRQGRLHAARGQEPRLLARRRQRLRRHRLRPGLADQVGLSADRQGMEARDAAGRGRGRLRGPHRGHVGATPTATSRPASSATSSSAGRPSSPPRRSSAATASSSRSTSPTTPRPRSTANGCCFGSAPTGPSAARPIRPGRCWRSISRRSSRGTDVRRPVRADRAEVAGGLQPDAALHPAQRAGQRPQPDRGPLAPRWEMAPRADAGLPEFVEAGASAVDPDDSDDYFLTTTGFLTPTTLSMGTAGGGPAETLKQLPAFFDAKGLAVTQHEAVSKDGTRIPYFEVAPRRPDARRQQPDPAHRLRRVRDPEAAVVQRDRRCRLAGEGGRVRRRQHPGRRRVRPAVAPGGAEGEPAQGLRGLHRRRRGPDRAARSPRRRTWASRAGATAAC